MGERLVVQFARGSRPRNENAIHERTAPRPRRTPHRMAIANLPAETSWQDLKDFARQSGLDVVYSEVGRDRDGKGSVEYETAADLRKAIEGLDNREFKGVTIRCTVDDRPRERHRSRSPPRHDYRRRSPPRDYYMDRYGGGRSPPRMRGPPVDDYPPRGRFPDDAYDPRGPPPRRYDADPYVNGHGRPSYDRPPSPGRRPRSPARAYEPGYERRY
ncbi:hypothetical protein P152DRAFT_331355 [Eremomyces bilateralis CBS 781.70]|uniref:RRM domain-containing protein n=1 Tax=Eremomyces bilateralis CBS 781.70 TaxID=1392243 RepID=A0A6G1G4L7_9PEZI|nr:uncharacterized protein P152DRAFT_331355 [Eremomyces bilateralis CBS 781.70]KAF1812942.1 hypothetical protein P152DRAFT_331355 [Eremomyces bilateralis CBS 781.70]